MNWFVPLVYGGGVGGVLLMLSKRYNYECGTVVECIRGVHLPGSIPFRHFVPMFFISLVTITAGGSCGPEAAVLVLGASATSLLSDKLLRQPMRQRRILTLCGMTAALASFFGMPLTAAMFVLEIPHANGLEYFEAVSPTVCSSVVAALVNKLITQVCCFGCFGSHSVFRELNASIYSDLWEDPHITFQSHHKIIPPWHGQL
jgi:H+/Cl- antiporter ClcA